MTTAVLSQSHFRARRDGATVDTAPDWIANVDTNWTQQAEIAFRIRFCVQETAGGNPNAATVKLQANLNGGAFFDVTTSSTIVKAIDYGASAEDTSIATARLGGTGSYIAGRFSKDGSPATTVDQTANSNTEWEFAVQINVADVANGDTITMKVVALSGTTITATTVPTITVSETAKSTSSSFLMDLTNPPKRVLTSAAAVAMALATGPDIPQPPYVAPITSSITSAGGDAVVLNSIFVYDMTVTPAPAPPNPVTINFVAQDDVPRPAKRAVVSDLSQPVIVPAQPVTLRPADPDAPRARKSVAFNEALVTPLRAPTVASAATPTQFGFVASDAPPRIKRRPPLNETAHVFTIPPIVATNTMASGISGPTIVAERTLVYDQTVTPLRPQAVAATATPSQFGFVSSPAEVSRPRVKPYAAASIVLAIPYDIYPPADTDAARPTARKARTVDEAAAPIFRATATTAPTPTALWFDSDAPRGRKRQPVNDLLASLVVRFAPQTLAPAPADAFRVRVPTRQNDAISAPLFGPRANAATPTQFGFEHVGAQVRAPQRLAQEPIAAPVARAPVQTLTPSPADAPRVNRPRFLNEPISAPVTPPAAPATATPSIALLIDETLRPVRNPPENEALAAPLNPPTAAVTTPSQALVLDDLLRPRKVAPVNEAIAVPLRAPVAVVTTPTSVPLDDAPRAAARARPVNEPISAPFFRPTAVTVVYGNDADPRPVRRRATVEALALPQRSLVTTPPGGPTPTQWGFEHSGSNPKSKAHMVVARLDTFASPILPPPVVVDATGLDDWLVRARRRGRR